MPPLTQKLRLFAGGILAGFLYSWPVTAAVVGYAWWSAGDRLTPDIYVLLACAVFAGFLFGARAVQATPDVVLRGALQAAYDLGHSDGSGRAYKEATERCAQAYGRVMAAQAHRNGVKVKAPH